MRRLQWMFVVLVFTMFCSTILAKGSQVPKDDENNGIVIIDNGTEQMSERDKNLFDAINAMRARYKLPLAQFDPGMYATAKRSVQVQQRRGLGHFVGGTEICAVGSGDPQQAVNMWLNSSGHRRIMMGGYTHMGAAVMGRYSAAQWVSRRTNVFDTTREKTTTTVAGPTCDENGTCTTQYQQQKTRTITRPNQMTYSQRTWSQQRIGPIRQAIRRAFR